MFAIVSCRFGEAIRRRRCRLGLASLLPPSSSSQGVSHSAIINIIDSYHRSYLHNFHVSIRPPARLRNELRTNKDAYIYLVCKFIFLSSISLIAAKIIEKSSRSIGKRTARVEKSMQRLTLSVPVEIEYFKIIYCEGNICFN